MLRKIITIDGPSASGKGTIAKEIAHMLGYAYLDSGSLYRIIAYIFSENKNSDIANVIDVFNNANIDFTGDEIKLNSVDISMLIRDERIGQLASKLAAIDEVRASLLIWQRQFCISQNLVTDGRDMGTVVFPQASLKIFLTADVHERAKRRSLQINSANYTDIYDEILADLIARDNRDLNRENAPLKSAINAITIDNTNMSIDASVNAILGYI
jgi:CMP/dCMP kinase